MVRVAPVSRVGVGVLVLSLACGGSPVAPPGADTTGSSGDTEGSTTMMTRVNLTDTADITDARPNWNR